MVIDKIEDLDKIISFIDNNTDLAYDIETTGLNCRKDSIVGFGVSNGSEGYYITHLAWNGETLEEVIPKSAIVPILNKLKTKKLYGWNFSFDSRFTLNFTNIDLIDTLFCDGMLAVHTYDENRFNYGLKETAEALYGSDSRKEQEDMAASIKENGGSSSEFYKADYKKLGLYCIKDCILTFAISKHFLSLLEQENLLKFFLEDEVMPLYKKVTIPMELKGVPIDLELIKSTYENIKKDLSVLECDIQKDIAPHLSEFETWYLNKEYPPSTSGQFLQGVIQTLQIPLPLLKSGNYSTSEKSLSTLLPIEQNLKFLKWLNGEFRLSKEEVLEVQKNLHGDSPMFNLLSKHHLKKLFFTKLKCKPVSFTEKGSPQVDEDFLESIKEDFLFVSKLIEFNKLTKIKGTYIERFLEKQENGIFYPSLLQHRTVSGRQSGDLQQLPKFIGEKQALEENIPPKIVHYTNLIRQFFIGGVKRKMVGADYESLEPHIFAHISGDQRIKNIFNTGEDFYSRIAIDTEGLKEYSANKNAKNYLGLVDKSKRQKSKSYALGIPYGMGGYKLSFELNIPIPEAELLVKKYLQSYPDLAKWMNNTLDFVLSNGFITSELGRKRRYPRLMEIYEQYGDCILDDLELWKTHHDNELYYKKAKKDRRELKNYINNAYNFQIQSLAASVVSRASIMLADEIKKEGLDAYIAMLVHDEIVCICSETTSHRLSQLMKTCMENVVNLTVKLKTEPNIAYRYSDTK